MQNDLERQKGENSEVGDGFERVKSSILTI